MQCQGVRASMRTLIVSAFRIRAGLAYRALPFKIAVGKHFSLVMAVCANAGAPLPASVNVNVDAQMPGHRHGMNYKPIIHREAAGRYRADGCMLHVPGRWNVIFELRAAGRTRPRSAKRGI